MMKGGTDTRRKLSLLEKLCICSEDTPKGCLCCRGSQEDQGGVEMFLYPGELLQGRSSN